MDDLWLISRGLYAVVSKKLGTESIVDMRRRVMALQQRLNTAKVRRDEVYEDQILSGSECEGFRFASSDRDWMFLCRNVRIIFSMTQCGYYNKEQNLLMAQCEYTKPGFVLLRMISDCSLARVRHACVQYEDGYYVSSEKWRENHTASRSFLTTHGPCSTTVAGNKEGDFAICIKSDRLPESAYGFVQRLHRAGWPSPSTLKNIVSDGCIFVPIGAKESFIEPLEWRISFSLAEKKLIHSMNHVQFLCYGMLKIFLKEAMDSNTEIKGLLCSYFLKTALFWEIASGYVKWDITNFLRSFWICFQRLLHWIGNEYCPKFFIPENNMFAFKIQGQARIKLLSYLVPIYSEGYRCLFRCPSIQTELQTLIQHPVLAMQMALIAEPDKCAEDTKLILELWNYNPFFEHNATHNEDLEDLMSENEDQLENSILSIWKSYSLQNYVIFSSFVNEDTMHNMQFDTTRNLLYAALYYYRRCEYRNALRLTENANLKLRHPQLLYPWCLDNDKYRAAGGEHKPFVQMMKEIVAWPIELKQNISITELIPEHQSAMKLYVDIIIIPPLVFVHFMSFLCHYRMQDVRMATSVLHDLCDLLHYDDGHRIDERDRAISWEILGICQEMSGDYQGAYQSYINASQQNWCHIKLASILRIQNLKKSIGVS